MSLISRLRQASLSHHRRFSTLLSQDSTTPLFSKQKTRAALRLIKTEKNPSRIVEICKAASLTPEAHLDRIALSVAITKLYESNHFEFIREFIDDLKSRPDLRTERFVSHAMVLYGQAKMIDHAIRTFEQCDELGVTRSVRVLNSLIFACILAKNYKEVNRVFVSFPKIYGIEPDLDTYNWVIKAFSESGSTSSAYSILAEMDRKGVKPNSATFSSLFSGFYLEERFEDVGKVMKLMEKYGFRPGVGTYNTRIHGLCKLKKAGEAKALLAGMLSKGMKPNSVTYSHLIHGFCKEGKLDEAKKLFKEMVHRGCQPDSNCYFTLVYFLCQGKDFESALEVSKESIDKNWVPNFSTMKSLVEGLASESKISEARELISVIKEKITANVDLWNEIEAGLP
ncbi:Tetratricopeptide-like helical domain containing protein [Parasponia andersonii]|uniref:Tetratricopeptide-like helical domain containing protein n=1 Tax=Parasponia andersonii TaxID=3476 RepID=A0A2P5APC5_PARAD|nr:Tetratricopeptide-like helical domain containing protein [Parasponia andersonii]